jgi:recombinational DNA repair ATPase RecF
VHITELRIRNYRNFTKAKFSFKPGLNTLIWVNLAQMRLFRND